MANSCTIPSFNDCKQSYTVTIVLIIVDCLITIFSAFGNILVVAVVYKDKNLRKNMNYYIVSMAISDLLVPLFNLPLQVSSFINDDTSSWIGGPFGEFTCRFLPYAVEVTIAVSILTMVTIAAERLYCVLFPFKASNITDKTCFLVIAIIWIVSISLQGYYLDLRGLDSKCGCTSKWDRNRRKIQIMTILVVQIGIPFVLLVVFGSVTVFSLYHDKMNAYLEAAEVKKRRKRSRKVTLMLVVITTVFLVAWIPFAIYRIRLLYGDKKRDCALYAVMQPVYFSYTVVNPLVYFAFLEGYRKGVKKHPLLFLSTQ